jgi:hypothetical protein
MSDELSLPARAALDRLRAERGPCPGGDALVAYDGVPVDARWTHPLHAHVQVCSRCQLVLHHLEEPAVDRRRVWVMRLLVPIAAGVLIAIVWPRAVPDQPLVVPTSTIRGSHIQPLAPVGPVARVTEFRWATPVAAARYRVVVSRNRQPVWTGETKTPELRVSDLPIERGVDYQWQVDALDANGEVILSSSPQTFALTF